MDPINLAEYETLAHERMERTAWDYYQSGAEDEITLRRNREAFARIAFRPRMLTGVGEADPRTTLFGQELALPVLVAPAAYQKLAHPEGEVAMARGAGAARTIMAVSTFATVALEEVAAAATGPLWFQLYVYRDRAVTEALVKRAEAASYQALVLTVDAPYLGRRERDIRNGFGLPPGMLVANFAGLTFEDQPGVDPGASGLAIYASSNIDPTLTWETVDWLRSISHLPVLVKGILTAEDAREAVAHGAGVVVSNHGGRQLDGAVAAIEALPEIVEAVAGRVPVLMDGGVRRGTDVLKALAIGADATLIGRPALWALAANGAAGVERAFGLLCEELKLAMALAGCKTIADVSRALVKLPPDW